MIHLHLSPSTNGSGKEDLHAPHWKDSFKPDNNSMIEAITTPCSVADMFGVLGPSEPIRMLHTNSMHAPKRMGGRRPMRSMRMMPMIETTMPTP
jgi:hypothetical protein